MNQKKIWGASFVRVNPYFLGAQRLRYCLANLRGIKGKVLEVGCGGGGMAKAIKFYNSDLDVYGCDINSQAIFIAQKNDQGVHFSVGDISKLPFPDSHFQAIVLFDVLEHLDQPFRALVEINRVLEDGGAIHMYVPCEGSPSAYVYWFRKLWPDFKKQSAGHIQFYSAPRLKEMVSDAGFTITEVSWSGHLILQLFDFLYFLFLFLTRKKINFSLEGLVEKDRGKKSIILGILGWVIKMVAIFSFFESRLLKNVSGLGIHLSGVKNERGRNDQVRGH